jgi:hypothetical protein
MTAPSQAGARRSRELLSHGLAFCVAMWLLQRLCLQGIGALVVLFSGVAPNSRSGPFGTFFNWDSGWYACISEYGYFGPACDDGASTERFAFFPLYPLLARLTAGLVSAGTVSDTSITFGLWMVAAAASFAATVILYRLVVYVHDEQLARRTVLFFLFGPYAIFLAASYSEALYIFFAVFAWYACVRQRYLLVALLGSLATLSRPSGLFLVPALIVLYVTTERAAGRRPGLLDGLAVACSGLGVVAYWSWLGWRTGDALAWFHAQEEGWNRRTQWPWRSLLSQGIHILREPRWDWQVQAVFELVFALGLIVAVVILIHRRDWAAATLVGLTAVSLMTSNSYLSLARNTLTLFPLTILVAWATLGVRQWVGRSVLAVSVVLLLFNTVQLALGNWAD